MTRTLEILIWNNMYCENIFFFLNSPRSTVSLYHCESDNDFSSIDTIRTHSAGHGCEFATGAETKHKYSKSVCACVFVYVHSFAISPFHRKTPSQSQHTVTKPWHHTHALTHTYKYYLIRSGRLYGGKPSCFEFESELPPRSKWRCTAWDKERILIPFRFHLI